jgi:hypothetical protein
MKNKPFHQIKDIVCNINEIIKKNIQFNIISIILSQDIIISNDNMNIIQIHIIDETGKIKMLIENISNLTILNDIIKIGNECIFRNIKAKLFNNYLYFIIDYNEQNNIIVSNNNFCKRDKISIESINYSHIQFKIIENLNL